MAKNKLILLALDFNSAPENVKAATEEMKLALERNQKAKDQSALWLKEKELAEREVNKAEKTLSIALDKWDVGIEKAVDKEEL